MPLWAVHRPTAFPDALGDSASPHVALARYFPLLDEQSVIKIKKFRLLADAQRCLLGRLLIRFLISTHYGIRWNSIQIQHSAAGRPYYESKESTPLDFNLSHDGDWVFLAWVEGGPCSVGIDVMKLALPWTGATLEDFIAGLQPQLTTREFAELLDLPRGAQLRRVCALWTTKEAYTKALGIGLGFDYSRIDMHLDPYSTFVDLVSVDGVELEGWSFAVSNGGEGHLVAVASRGGFWPFPAREVSLEEMVVQSERMEST